jgi:hypothetical protein
MKKFNVVLGSLGGAVAVHFGLACMNSESSGGTAARADSGDSADARSSCACSASPSGTRLKGLYIQGADGLKAYDPTTFYDSQLATDCRLTALSDGNFYCAPATPTGNSNYSGLLFADTACTQILYFSATGDLLPKFAYYTVSFSTAADADLQRVYPIGQATTGPAHVYLWNFSAQSCEAYTSSVAGTWYQTGAELQPSQFVALSQGHD